MAEYAIRNQKKKLICRGKHLNLRYYSLMPAKKYQVNRKFKGDETDTVLVMYFLRKIIIQQYIAQSRDV